MNKSFIGKSAASKLKKAFALALSCSTLVWAMGAGALSLAVLMTETANAAVTTAHPNGVLVDIGDANHTIYLISGGKRFGIPSPTVFASHGYNFNKVVTANSFDKALAEGDVIKYADSTLVRSGQEISLIGGGQKRGFTAPEVFTGLGYSFTQSAIVVPEAGYLADYNAYSTGTPIASASEAHPNGSLVNINGVISQISDGKLAGIPSPEVFASRGLDWKNVVAANAADKALSVASENMKFADGTLVLSAADNTTVYVISDGKKMGVTTPAALEAYGYDWKNLVKGDVASYTEGALITDGIVNEVVTGTNSVSLAADSPAVGTIAKGAQDVVFAKYTFTADANGYTVSSISVIRGGYAADADITAVKLYDGTTQLGSTQALNTTTHKAGFTGLNVAVPANGSKTITVKGNIWSSAGIGNSVQLGIAAASDITATAVLSGTYPMYGSAKNIASVAVGVLDVDVRTTPAANTNMLSGSTDQAIASWTFAASSTEGFKINAIKLTNVGSAGDNDFSNIKLKYNATELATATKMTNSSVTFTLASPLEVKASQSKAITAYCNVSEGITTGRTLQFEITRAEDISAAGMNSGGNVTATKATGGSGTAFTRQTGNLMTIGQGTLTTALDTASNPSAQSYVKGTTGNLMTALKFSAGSKEGARITQLTLTLGGTSAASTDISNVCLHDPTKTDNPSTTTIDETLIGSCGSIIGTTVQFGTNTINTYDATGLFDVAASTNKVIDVKADVPTGADATHTISLSISDASDVKADGLVSQNDLPAASVTGTAAGTAHTISANGTLTLTAAGDSPSATTLSKGTTDQLLAKFDMAASAGEDIVVNSITITFKKGAGADTAMVDGDLTNVDFYDGTTLLGTDNSVITDATLSVNLTVAKSTTKTISIYADIPSTTTATYATAKINAATDVDTTGAASSATSLASGTPTAATHTISTGSLTATMSGSPIYASVTANVTDLVVGNLVLTAGTAEDLNISQIKVTKYGTAGTTKAVADANVTALKIFDGATQLSESKTLTSGQATFGINYTVAGVNHTNITVTKGTSKTITIKASLDPSATGNIIVGIKNYGTDISVSGASSSATIYANYLGVTDTAGLLDATDFATELATIITAGTVAAGDVITIGAEDILVNVAAMTTVTRSYGGAAASAEGTAFALGAVVTKKASTKVLAASNAFSGNADTALIFASSIDGTIAKGDLVTVNDADVAASADDVKLVTVIDADGDATNDTLTMVDAFYGAAFTETANPDDGAGDDMVTVWDSYGQALKIETVGALAVDVVTGDPVTAQIVAGTTDLPFTKIKFTATYEDVKVSMLKLTTSGGRAADFSAVKITYTYDAAGATKTASESITGTTVTFNLASGSEIYCKKNTPRTITVSADVRTIEAGSVSGDAPKFYLAAVSAANMTAKGASTGTALSSFTSTTAPTSGNVVAQTIYKTKLLVDVDTTDTGSASTFSPASDGSFIQTSATEKELARFYVSNSTNSSNQIATLKTLTVTLSRSSITVENIKLYKADGNQLSSTVVAPPTSTDNTATFSNINLEIEPGTGQEIYVTANANYEGAGTISGGSVQAIIANIASGGNITWTDGETTNITWVNLPGKTAVSNTGVFSFTTDKTDSRKPRLSSAVITDAGTGGFGNDVGDVLTLVFTEVVNTNFTSAAAPTKTELDAIFDSGAGASPFTGASVTFSATDLSSTASRTLVITVASNSMTVALTTSSTLNVQTSPTANDIEDAANNTCEASTTTINVD